MVRGSDLRWSKVKENEKDEERERKEKGTEGKRWKGEHEMGVERGSRKRRAEGKGERDGLEGKDK